MHAAFRYLHPEKATLKRMREMVWGRRLPPAKAQPNPQVLWGTANIETTVMEWGRLGIPHACLARFAQGPSRAAVEEGVVDGLCVAVGEAVSVEVLLGMAVPVTLAVGLPEELGVLLGLPAGWLFWYIGMCGRGATITGRPTANNAAGREIYLCLFDWGFSSKQQGSQSNTLRSVELNPGPT
jgi:hypothetical protein